MAKNKQDKMGHAKAEVRASVVVVKDDGSHGHVCQHCSVTHRHVDPKCPFIGLAYMPCPERQEPSLVAILAGPGFEEAVAAVEPGDSFDTVEG